MTETQGEEINGGHRSNSFATKMRHQKPYVLLFQSVESVQSVVYLPSFTLHSGLQTSPPRAKNETPIGPSRWQKGTLRTAAPTLKPVSSLNQKKRSGPGPEARAQKMYRPEHASKKGSFVEKPGPWQTPAPGRSSHRLRLQSLVRKGASSMCRWKGRKSASVSRTISAFAQQRKEQPLPHPRVLGGPTRPGRSGESAVALESS